MTRIRPREPVVLATDFDGLIDWYRETLGFKVLQRFDEDFHYCALQAESGMKVAIAAAGEMGVVPGDRTRNTVVLQFEVDDVEEFFAHVEASDGSVTSGPSYDKKSGFWFGGIADPEGNPYWVVDKNCP